MRLWNNLKIWPKLLLIYFFGAVLPILLIACYLISQLYNVSFENSMTASMPSLVQLRANYAAYMESCSDTASKIARDPSVVKYINTVYPQDSDAIITFLQNIAPLVRNKQELNVNAKLRIFSDNPSIYFSQEMSNDLAELKNEDWYSPDYPVKDGSWNWGATKTLTKNNYGPGIVCYSSIYKSAGSNEISHVAAMFFEEAPLYQLTVTESAFGNKIFLINAAGTIVSGTERELLLGNFESLNITSSLDGQKLGEVIKYNDEDYFCQILPLKTSGSWLDDWHVVRLLPADGIRKSVTQATVPGLFVCGLCILFGLVLITAMAHSIRTRVDSLKRNMIEVTNSGFEKEFEPKGGDEIGDIERSFMSVAQQTKRLIHEVYETKLIAAQYEKQTVDARLMALRGQINPHYLFNTLESIRMNLVLSGDRKTANIVHLFAESFRTCIEDDDKESYTLEKELSFLNRYFAIQDYRMRGKISLITDVPSELLNCLMPKLILQPLLENAVYHGLEMKEGLGTVRLSACKRKGLLHIEITDDGVGMEKSELRKLKKKLNEPYSAVASGESLALRNVNSRLKLMYNDSFGIIIESAKGVGTKVTLDLKIVYDYERRA